MAPTADKGKMYSFFRLQRTRPRQTVFHLISDKYNWPLRFKNYIRFRYFYLPFVIFFSERYLKIQRTLCLELV